MTSDRRRLEGAAGRDVRRGEWLFFAAILVVATFVRARNLSAIDVEHFDEGVYASRIYCSHLSPPNVYPLEHLYAPPVWPMVLSETLVWLGPNAVALPGVLIGIVSVALTWWVAREWYGPTAAVVSATMLCLSDVHILFSRSMLTDVPMAGAMLAGVYAGWKALTTRSNGWLVVSGVLAGFAWSTKYNGWLTLAVIGSAAVAWRFVERSQDDVRESKPLLRCLVISAIAIVVWLPVFNGLQTVGGYASVSENHRQFFVGVSGWWTSAVHQIRMVQVAATSGTIWPFVGLVGVGLLAIRPLKSTWVFLATAFIGTRLRLLTFIVPSVGTSIRGLMNLPNRDDERSARRLSTWLTLAWLFGLTLAIPLYTPYLRLVVPLTIAGCLCWGDLVSRWTSFEPATRHQKAQASALFGVVVAIWFVGEAWTSSQRPMSLAESLPDRTSVSQVADRFLSQIPAALTRRDPSDVGLYVYGEPSLYFQFAKREGDRPFDYLTQPAGNLGILDRSKTDPTLTPIVAVGPHGVKLTPEILSDERLELIDSVSVTPSLLVGLDNTSREELTAPVFEPKQSDYWLFRVRRRDELDRAD